MSSMVAIDSQKLKTVCEEQQLKMWWVAEMAQIHRSTLRRWLKGCGAHAHSDKAKRLADVLQISLSSISR